MTCRKCGELLSDGVLVCPVCGARQTASAKATVNPVHKESEDCAHETRQKRPNRHTRGLGLFLFVAGFMVLVFGLMMLFPDIFLDWGGYLLFIPLIVIFVYDRIIKRRRK